MEILEFLRLVLTLPLSLKGVALACGCWAAGHSPVLCVAGVLLGVGQLNAVLGPVAVGKGVRAGGEVTLQDDGHSQAVVKGDLFAGDDPRLWKDSTQ